MENIYFNLNVPRLDIINRFGATQYIDFIKWDEVTSPIMKGTDYFGRYFVVIKFFINDMKIMQTFFQRYTNGNGWMGCGHATENLIETPGYIKPNQLELIQKVINGEFPTITSDHIPSLNTFIGKNVCLYDTNKFDAIVKIQRAWLRCRYNPKYKMCAKVQDRNMQIILNNK